MTVNNLIRELGLTAAAGRKKRIAADTSGCYVGDILSYALSHAKKDEAWITTVTDENTAAVGLATGVSCIILADSQVPDSGLVRACRREDIPLLLSKDDAYSTAVKIYDAQRKCEFDKKYKSLNSKSILNVYISGSFLCGLK